tara:strand:- start:93 stop:461 length:369 start_codon:yes stop_codon:yes gene_type:complete
MVSKDEEFIDYARVRDFLIDARERRGFPLSFEQKMALQHAEWAASEGRNGYITDSKVYQKMFELFVEIDKISNYPEVAAKLAEIMPMAPDEVRAILASRRIAVDDSEVENIIDIVRKNVGVE